MPPRFDDDKLVLKLSVADLVERESARTFGFANRGGFERMWLGQAIHSEYQETALETDPTYQREVTVKHTVTYKGWQVEIHGRIDGLRRDENGVHWVEEIKSVRGSLSPTVLAFYQRQALYYAWMYRESFPEDERPSVVAELVLIPIGQSTPDARQAAAERILFDLDVPLIQGMAEKRIAMLLREHDQKRAQRAMRRAAADSLEFPFFKTRDGQQQIIDRTQHALEEREHLLVEAATGLGKTVASLFPVLRYGLAHDKRIFVLTAKTLQQDMAAKVLNLLNRDEAFRSLRLRAKAKMCANHEVICHEEYCQYAKDFHQKVHNTKILHHLLSTRSQLEPDDIYETSREVRVCPFEISLELSRNVEVVVCDYNYAFDPYVALTDFHEENDLSDTILVIDEIHNLVGRGRGYYSPELSANECRAVSEALPALHGVASGSSHGTLARMDALAKSLAVLIERTTNDQLPPSGPTPKDAIAEGSLPGDALFMLRPEFDRTFVEYLEYRRETSSFRAEDPFVDLYFKLVRFLATLAKAERHQEAFSFCVERSRDRSGTGRSGPNGQDHLLRILCKDASAFLGQTINRTHTTIGLSATLSPPDFYTDLLGLDRNRSSNLRLPNPFPKENRAIVIDSSVSTTYKNRAQHYATIAERLAEFSSAVPGNCLALFPSYEFLRRVHQDMPELENRRILVQSRADTESERQEILDTLRSALFGDVLLLAVAGGVFAEGVDYPGDMLKAVAVVSPCLPGLSLERKLLQDYYDQTWERGFEYAYVVPGMTRVVQAAGRLIRSPEDRGVIALIGKRFLHKPYRTHLPADWLGEAHEESFDYEEQDAEFEEPFVDAATGILPGAGDPASASSAGAISKLIGHPASVAAAFFGTSGDS